ncbi:WD domain-containing protein [Colletotrichum graminicola]|uniref:ASTRA-associated protein 1 n=1 Tax=Colletotrichum graminicola (strain M1.001 / M2 / FGSC 10212) TaxID=645133 RepID=E3QI52_COLGM|nr:WD domain-containing protein [Colletotrichum graminicola M1.001]EFQ30667.1 WD domain-containing protein [Colletotrichum graminicola M1.001]WDK21401.1 WD domain-containing protein [Colletotrichum graminicola]
MTDEVPHPKSILRGHKAQVHALAFVRGNERLASGDAEGFVVLWDLTILRPTAVWRPHENAILGIEGWGDDRIITHGRDHRLAVWQLGPKDESHLSKKLPLDETPEPRPQPWLLHLIGVNTMNFCSFASCVPLSEGASETTNLLLAVPNTLASESVDVYELPSKKRLHTVKTTEKNGMVMALALLYVDGVSSTAPSANSQLTLVAGYENGLATVRQFAGGTWNTIYLSQVHNQPILSLAVVADQGYFLTSGADAVVAKHPIPGPNPAVDGNLVQQPLKILNTKHSGQQGLRIRDDGRIFATAGWDSTIRVYSAKTLKEVATLKWHQVGCYAVALANVKAAPRAHETRGASRDLISHTGQISVKDRRIQQAQSAHWLAAGSKDGKISLWDIF